MRTAVLLAIFVPALVAQNRLPRIGMGGIVHETNTFNPKKTTVADFETGLGGANGILRGEAIIRELASSNNTIAGFIDGAKEHRLELYPTIMAGPQTIGAVTKEAFETLTGELIDRLKKAPKLDGILLFLHGTMVADGYPHADAEVVRRVRQAMGEQIPIIVVHDFHANVSERL